MQPDIRYREQRFQLAPGGFRLERLQTRFRLGDDAGILLRLAEIDQHGVVLDRLLDAGDGGQLILERIALLHHLAGARRIVPQIGVFRRAVELGEPHLRAVEVKDASSAVQWTA